MSSLWGRREWLAVALLTVVLGAGCQKGSESGKGTAGNATGAAGQAAAGGAAKRIILLTNGDDPFWDAMRAGMEKAQAEFGLEGKGFRVVMDKNDATPEGQVEKLRQYLGQTDIAAVGISVIDPDNASMASAMRDLRAKGIVVVTIDSDVNREKFRDTRFAYLGTENTFGGRQMGLAAKSLLPEGGSYAAFYGIDGVSNVTERVGGFVEGAGESFQKAVGIADGMDHTVAQDNVRNAIENHPGVKALIGIWAYNAHAIVTVVKERNLRDKVKVIVFDAAPKAIQHLKDGLIDAMVVQDPYGMGYDGTRLMAGLYSKDHAVVKELYPDYDPDKGEITSERGDIRNTDVRVVVPEGSPLKKESFDPSIKFFTIGEFDKWLSERKLTGS